MYPNSTPAKGVETGFQGTFRGASHKVRARVAQNQGRTLIQRHHMPQAHAQPRYRALAATRSRCRTKLNAR
jgi:hypothetical protein